MQLEMIVAVAKNGVIGGGNQMLWHVKEDFQHFKATTMGAPIIMGRKTHESIGRALPGRLNVVVTRDAHYKPLADNVTVVTSLEAAYEAVGDVPRAFVIGGGELYRQAYQKAQRIWLTLIDKDFEGDTTFPMPSETDFTRTDLSHLDETEARDFKVFFTRWDRKTTA